jgi:hypothetical protein
VYINRRRQEFKVSFFSLYHTIPQKFNDYKSTKSK